jgi:hypothetical protein
LTLVVEDPSTWEDLGVLSPANDLYFGCRELGAVCAVLVPPPALLASVHNLEVGVTDWVKDLGQGRVAGVVFRRDVATIIH